MELHELEIGDLRPGSQRGGQAVTAASSRARGPGPQLPIPTGGQDDGTGVNAAERLFLGVPHERAGHGLVIARRQQIDQEEPRHYRNISLVCSGQQGSGYFRSRSVPPGVDHSGHAVTAFPGQGAGIEAGSKTGQDAHRFDGFFGYRLRHHGVSQTGRRPDRVSRVRLRVVPRPQCRRYPSLGQQSAPAPSALFGDDGHSPPTGKFKGG